MAPLSASKNFIIFDIKVFDSSVFLIFVFNISHNSIVADIFSLKEDSSAIITAAWLVSFLLIIDGAHTVLLFLPVFLEWYKA